MKLTTYDLSQVKPKKVRTSGKYQFHDRTGAVLPPKRKRNDRRVNNASHK